MITTTATTTITPENLLEHEPAIPSVPNSKSESEKTIANTLRTEPAEEEKKKETAAEESVGESEELKNAKEKFQEVRETLNAEDRMAFSMFIHKFLRENYGKIQETKPPNHSTASLPVTPLSSEEEESKSGKMYFFVPIELFFFSSTHPFPRLQRAFCWLLLSYWLQSYQQSFRFQSMQNKTLFFFSLLPFAGNATHQGDNFAQEAT
jgi:hypothetical protein